MTFVRSELSLKKTQSKRRMPKILTRLKRSGSTNRRARRSVVDAFRISQVGDVSTSSLHVHLPLLGISLIDDYIPEEEPNHVRQELVYLSLHAIHYYETLAGSEKRTGLSVGLMQADNQMEKSSYPIVFCQKQLARGRCKMGGQNTRSATSIPSDGVGPDRGGLCNRCQWPPSPVPG